MKSLRIASLIAAISLLSMAAYSQNGPRSFIIDGPDAMFTYAWGINFNGQVTGGYGDSAGVFHGYLRHPNGKLETFTPSDAMSGGTFPYAINRAGAITGNYITDEGKNYGFIRFPDGTFTRFAAADPSTGVTGPVTINDRGDVAGTATDSNGVNHGFLRKADGTIKTFDVPSVGGKPAAGTAPGLGTFVNYSNSLNNAGYIVSFYIDSVGYDRGYLRAPDGTFTVIEAPLSAPSVCAPGEGSNTQGTVGQSINSMGVIAGITIDKFGVWHGFKLTPDGTYTIIDVPGAGSAACGGTPLGWGTIPEAINDRGEISGYFSDANDLMHAFLVSPQGVTVYDAPGAIFGTESFNMNLPGMITGYFYDGDGVFHGFVRMP